jgi:hypothetical protein
MLEISARQLNIGEAPYTYVLETDDATACLSSSGLYALSFWAICLPGFNGRAACTLQVDINKGNPNGNLTPRQFILVSTWKEYSFQFQISDSPLSVGLIDRYFKCGRCSCR